MKAQLEKIPFGGRVWRASEFVLPHFNYPWHFHPELELTLIVRSRGTRYVGDHVSDFKAGDLVLLGSHLPHVWLNETGHCGRAHSIVIQFRNEILSPAFLPAPELHRMRELFGRAARGFAITGTTGREIQGRMIAMMKTPPLHQLGELFEILSILAQARRGLVPLASEGYVPRLNTGDSLRIHKILKLLHDGFTRDIPLAEAARLVSMSPSAFSRYFKRRTGSTYITFLNDLRLSQAGRLLTESDRSVAEIAFASGYRNLAHFNRQFRQKHGMPPKMFRSRMEPT